MFEFKNILIFVHFVVFGSRSNVSTAVGLLKRNPAERLGCKSGGVEEMKELPFFASIDWSHVYNHRLTPPLIPPRGEVNAADAFDIGSFDDEETKHIRLDENDQKQYEGFAITLSDRWQAEITETVFEVNTHTITTPTYNKTATSKVGAISKAQKAKNF